MCRRSSKSFHRSPFLVISPLGSPVGRSHLAHSGHFTARRFRSFHCSPRPSNGLTSLSLPGRFTARLPRRTVSPRTAIPVISPLGSPVERSHLALPFRSFHRSARPSNGLTSHCHSGYFTARLVRRTVSPRTATLDAAHLALPSRFSPR